MEYRSEDLAGRERGGRREMPFSSPALTVLGSTGSIGTQTLDVARMHGYRIKAMSAHSNFRLAEEQAREFLPETVCMTDETAYAGLTRHVEFIRHSDLSIGNCCHDEVIRR